MSEIEEALKRVIDVPTLPASVVTVLQMLETSECSVNDLAKVIATDAPMAAKVLKVANSSFYGFRQKIVTINQAITVLGFTTLRNALVSMSVFEMFQSPAAGLDMPGLWMHSVGTATAARVVAQRLRYSNGDKAFTAGLLHDLGKVIVARYLPLAALQSQAIARQHKSTIERAEVHVYGASHADIGAWLLKRWNLPQPIVEAVHLHHRPTEAEEHFNLTAIVYLANILCHQAKIGNSGDRDDLTVDARVSSHFKLTESDFTDLRELLVSKKQEIAGYLQSTAKAA